MTSDADALDQIDPPEVLSSLGGPGLTWAGDGALVQPRSGRSTLDVEAGQFPPILEDGESGFPLASFSRRWVGFLIDMLVIIGLGFAVTLVIGAPESADAGAAQGVLTVSLIKFGYGYIFNPRGWSPGKVVVGLRIVKQDGSPPGLRRGLMRTAGTIFSEIFYLGYLWAIFDSRRQTWHDKLAKTYVVRVEEDEAGASDGPRLR
jgi:uncharacterized RDD family membrane protein YckC